jgi:hypothetical protein
MESCQPIKRLKDKKEEEKEEEEEEGKKGVLVLKRRATAQELSRQPRNEETRIRSQAIPYEICDA